MYKHTFADCDTDIGKNIAKWGGKYSDPNIKSAFLKSKLGILEDPILTKNGLSKMDKVAKFTFSK